jgi:putative hemolysin
MNLLPSDQVHTKSVMNKLPPLIKGYLRVGAWVGDGAYIDRQWNSVDVFILVKTDKITPKYMEHYGLSGVVNDPLLPE